MTKTQKTTHVHEPVKNAPLNASRYTGFYLTMLILSTVGTSFALLGLISIPDVIKDFSVSPLYSIFSLFSAVIILPVAIWALVLLWLKRPLGIWLKLGTYAASLISTIGIMFTAAPIVKQITQEALAEAKKTGDSIDSALVEGVASFALYVGIGFSIIVSITFGLLWWFAWKKQKEADSE